MLRTISSCHLATNELADVFLGGSQIQYALVNAQAGKMELYYSLKISRWVWRDQRLFDLDVMLNLDIGLILFCRFMDRDESKSRSTNVQTEDQYPAIYPNIHLDLRLGQ